MEAIILLDVPKESIGTMCSVTYVDEQNNVKQEPCMILGYDRLDVDIKIPN